MGLGVVGSRFLGGHGLEGFGDSGFMAFSLRFRVLGSRCSLSGFRPKVLGFGVLGSTCLGGHGFEGFGVLEL